MTDQSPIKQNLTSLYRYFDDAGALLYIGISKNILNRLPQHSDKPWIALAASVTVEHFQTRDGALDAERRAIQRELPRFNVLHNARAKQELADNTTVEISRDTHKQWAKFMELPGGALASRVLHIMVARMSAENTYATSPADLAREMKVTDRALRRALPLLQQYNLIQSLPVFRSRERLVGYRINSSVAWSGHSSGINDHEFIAPAFVPVCQHTPEDPDA